MAVSIWKKTDSYIGNVQGSIVTSISFTWNAIILQERLANQTYKHDSGSTVMHTCRSFPN